MAPPDAEYGDPPDFPESQEYIVYPAPAEGVATVSCVAVRDQPGSGTATGVGLLENPYETKSISVSSIIAQGEASYEIDNAHDGISGVVSEGSAEAESSENYDFSSTMSAAGSAEAESTVDHLIEWFSGTALGEGSLANPRERKIEAVSLEVSWASFEYDAGEIFQVSCLAEGVAASEAVNVREYSASSVASGTSSLTGVADSDATIDPGCNLLVTWVAIDLPKGNDAFLVAIATGIGEAQSSGEQKSIVVECFATGSATTEISAVKDHFRSCSVSGSADVFCSTFSNLDDYEENWACNIEETAASWGCDTIQSSVVWGRVSSTHGTGVEVWDSGLSKANPSWASPTGEETVEWTKVART